MILLKRLTPLLYAWFGGMCLVEFFNTGNKVDILGVVLAVGMIVMHYSGLLKNVGAITERSRQGVAEIHARDRARNDH